MLEKAIAGVAVLLLTYSAKGANCFGDAKCVVEAALAVIGLSTALTALYPLFLMEQLLRKILNF